MDNSGLKADLSMWEDLCSVHRLDPSCDQSDPELQDLVLQYRKKHSIVKFKQIKNKPPKQINRPVIIACSKMRNINLSSIARAASGSGVHTIVGFGFGCKIKSHVSRNVEINVKNRSITYLNKLRKDGYRIVALEQTTNSIPLPSYKFQPKTVLVAGNENHGVSEKILALVDDTVEIPMFGMPVCHSVATAAAIALYEYCRQYPEG